MKKTRFVEPVYLRPRSRERRLSCGNDRTLNPSISLGDQGSPFSTKRVQDSPHYLQRRMGRLSIGSTCEESPITRNISSKASNSTKNLKFTSSATKKRTDLSKGRETVIFLYYHLGPVLTTGSSLGLMTNHQSLINKLKTKTIL